MKSIINYIAFLLFTVTLSAQNEVEFVNIMYTNSGNSNFSESPYTSLDQVSSANSIFSATLNYGHELKKNTANAFYSLSYRHFNQELDITKVSNQNEFEQLPKNYYKYPSFSLISLTTGFDYRFSEKWSASIIGSANFTDDLSGSEVNSNLTWLSMAYVERQTSEHFSYGLGVFVNQLENKLLFTPSLSLKIKNEKRGFEMLIPDKIRFWQKLNKHSYIEALIKAQSLSIEYPQENIVRGMDIYNIKAGLSYSYIWQDFIKLNVGVDFPLILNSLNSTIESFEFLQQNSIGFNLGFSIIVPGE